MSPDEPLRPDDPLGSDEPVGSGAGDEARGSDAGSPGSDEPPDPGDLGDGEDLGDTGGESLGGEPAEPAEPLAPEERESIEADLEDLESMQVVFETQGAKGVVIACTECGENHYYGWELLRESLEHMLATGEPRMHEPAYQPREDDYVVWDYGKGYVDALADAGLEDGAKVEVTQCGWCETPVEPHFAFCPRCGRSMAVLRMYQELVDRGIDEREVRALLIRAGFEPFA